MELVPLSITLSTSPVFLALCHLTYHITFGASHLHIVLNLVVLSQLARCFATFPSSLDENLVGQQTTPHPKAVQVVEQTQSHLLCCKLLHSEKKLYRLGLSSTIKLPDPEDILKACNQSTLPTHATLKKSYEGVKKDCFAQLLSQVIPSTTPTSKLFLLSYLEEE